jgi:5'-nucleotidase
LRVQQYFVLNKVKIFSVTGTPCDCVTLALDKILLWKPDLIIGGVCERYCRGETIYSSGCVSAAIEGTIQGIPSIALSAGVRDHSDEKFYVPIANSFAKSLPYFMKHMPKGTTLNINYPEKFSNKKVVCTHLTCRMLDNQYYCETNPYGNTFYWLKPSVLGYQSESLEQRGDVYWQKHDFITVTPLKMDLTSNDAILILESAGVEL